MYTIEEIKRLRLIFWQNFGRYSASLKALRPNRGRWISYHTGIKHLELKFEVQRNVVRVMMEVNHKSEDKRLMVYEQLEKYKVIIEETFGGELIWDYTFTTESGNEVCRVYVENAEYDFHNQKNWPQMYSFMGQNMIQLEAAFKEIKDVIEAPE